MNRTSRTPTTTGKENTVFAITVAVLIVLALISVTTSFFRHFTPDNSIYLLHTRTFLETLNRFTYSFDSKGIMIVWFYAPAVLLLGPTLAAAALSQLVFYLIGFFFLYRIIRSFLDAKTAVIVGLLWIFVSYSPNLWGGNARPENFCSVLVILALYAVLRNERKWFIIAGAATALCLFTKTTLALTPAVLSLVGAVLAFPARNRASVNPLSPGAIRNLVAVAAGFFLIAGVHFGWIFAFDDPARWMYQTLIWPMQMASTTSSPWNLLAVFYHTGLYLLFAGSITGMLLAWKKGPRRFIMFCALIIITETVRVLFEGTSWNYLLLVMAMPLLAGASLLRFSSFRFLKRVPGWTFPILFLAPVFWTGVPSTGKAFFTRVIHHYPSPFEELASRMDSLYKQGESIYVEYNDYQLILMFDAPRPYPVLPLHFRYVSATEQDAIRGYYKSHPPRWVVTRDPGHSAVSYRTEGEVDGAYHLYFPGVQADKAPADSVYVLGDVTRGNILNPALSSELEYKLTIDIGYAQAWRLCAGR
ncbi:MAG: glycosyltransferase family 39 protein [Chlorobi bacterium]|nr:glycosyltransferase family 39 protein [Chlorobiota bacterium]